jgi:hypothetical protein
MKGWPRTTFQKQREQRNANRAYHLATQRKDHEFPVRDSRGRHILCFPLEQSLARTTDSGRVVGCSLLTPDVIVMVYGKRLYVRTSILNAKSRQPKIGLQVDGRAVDPNRMDTGLKSIGVGSRGVAIVALAVSNCVIFAVSRRFQDANPGH